MSLTSFTLSVRPARWNKAIVLPIFVGILATFAMFGMYVLILTVLQDFSHAMQQAAQDWLWVGLVAVGFGTQIGFYTYLRLLVSTARVIGATVATGTGTGTSTLGMVACCAHHLTDLAPLVALTGVSGLSGAISFLNDWKYPFIALGLIVNAIGMVITIQTIRKSRAHLNATLAPAVTASAGAGPTVTETVPACH